MGKFNEFHGNKRKGLRELEQKECTDQVHSFCFHPVGKPCLLWRGYKEKMFIPYSCLPPCTMLGSGPAAGRGAGLKPTLSNGVNSRRIHLLTQA